jgi:hypothetical protein
VELLEDVGRSKWAAYPVIPDLDADVKVLLDGCP